MIICFQTKLKAPALLVILGAVFSAAVGSGDVAAAEAKGIEVSKEDCARIIAHQPAADVEYRPGVDASGRPVVPADLPGSAIIEAQDKIVIPLTLDVADLFSLPTGVAGKADIGTIEYDIMSGRLEYNGKPLTDPQLSAISAACATMKK